MRILINIISFLVFANISCKKNDTAFDAKEFHMELLWSYGFEHTSSPNAEPIINSDYVYTTGGPGIHKLSKYSGKKIWYTKYSSLASSLLGENYVHTNEHIIGLVPNQVLCFSKQSGEIIWERTLLEYNYLSHMGYSSKFEDYFYIGSETGNLFKINISDGTVYEIANLEHYIRDTYALSHDKFLLRDIIHSDSINVTNIGVYSVSNNNWVWNKTFRGIGYFSYGYPIIEDEKVYIGTTRGFFGCFDKETGEIIWENYANELYTRAFSISDDKIFINCVYNVCCLDKNTGELIWITERLGSSEFSRVFQRNGFVYWARSKGFYVYDAETGEKLLYHSNPDGGYSWTSTITDSAYYVQTAFNLFKYNLLAKEDD